MKKLITKTNNFYLAFAIIALVLSAPIFYYISTAIYLEDVDESILLRQKEFHKNELQKLNKKDIASWNRFNRDIKILPDTSLLLSGEILNQTFYDTLDHEYEPYRVLYEPIKIQDQKQVLMIRMNMVESEDLIFTIGILYLLVFGILMLGLIVLAKLFNKRLWKPFYASLDALQSFNLSTNHLPDFEATDIFEFDQLNETLKHSLTQNLQVYKVQKEFSENASHELQTPLALFKTKLDMMLQTADLTFEQSEIISQLYETTARLERINKNLLLLSKIENNQFVVKESFLVNELLKQQIPYLEEQAEEKNIKISIRNETPLKIAANKTLTEILLNNLLLNALKHNEADGVISIGIQNDSIVISNSGEPNSLKSEKLYSRFSKVKNSSQGSGLGLAISKKIVVLNGWSIAYSFVDGLHTFSVKMKG